MHERRYWFRKGFGLSWRPATREGWATTIAWLAFDSIGSRVLHARSGGDRTVARWFRAASAFALVAIVIATGEPVRR